jgi:4-coumarate--CoA ligase
MAAMTIYKSSYPNVPVVEQNVFELLLHIDPSKPELIGGFPADSTTFIDAQTGTTLTRASLRSYATTLAYALRTHSFFPQHQPLNRGDTIMIFSPNTLTWPVLLYAATCAGLRVTLANASYTAEELEYQLNDSGSKILFVHPTLVSVAREAMGDRDLPLIRIDCEWLTGVPDQGEKEGLSVYDLFSESGGRTWEPERFSGVDFNETVLMCYSSGTTGKPKGVQVSTMMYSVTPRAFKHVFYLDVRKPHVLFSSRHRPHTKILSQSFVSSKQGIFNLTPNPTPLSVSCPFITSMVLCCYSISLSWSTYLS